MIVLELLGLIFGIIVGMFFWSIIRDGWEYVRANWTTPEERTEKAKRGY